jgi:hypothetical protein
MVNPLVKTDCCSYHLVLPSSRATLILPYNGLIQHLVYPLSKSSFTPYFLDRSTR